jgi:hypothetical protein
MSDVIIQPPTKDDVYAEQIELVESHADPSWRHGCYMREVYHRASDDTYWQVSYQRTGDGEYNSLRDGDAEFERVYPVSKIVTITTYTKTAPL